MPTLEERMDAVELKTVLVTALVHITEVEGFLWGFDREMHEHAEQALNGVRKALALMGEELPQDD